MLPLALGGTDGAEPLSVLALGAHPDDAEIGCGGTILKLIGEGRIGRICWVVLSGKGERVEEARASAEAMLAGVPDRRILQPGFRDGYFPYDGSSVKDFFEDVRRDFEPDLVLTHQRRDLHQDHRITCELTWNTFRNHLILEYEVPKYDGDMGRPNLYVPLADDVRTRKAEHLVRYFGSQTSKHWFEEELFAGLARLRGMECNAPSGYAEAFYAPKAVLA